MKLYLNDKEARLIRATLLVSTASMTQDQRDMANRILDRMNLCDKLQNNERRSRNDDR